MSRFRTTPLVACALVVAGFSLARAQIVVTDPAVTFRNTAIAVLKESILGTLTDQAG